MGKRILEKAGYDVIGIAANGAEAVRMTVERGPDVLLLDIVMPEMDGLDAARQIQERRPTPVVVLTSYDVKKLVDEASLSGVGAYLLKPMSLNEVERSIAIAMARFKDLMELRRLNQELREAASRIKTLSGLLPICAGCKKIRDDSGYWQEVDRYLSHHSEAQLSHGLCPDCIALHYPELKDELSLGNPGHDEESEAGPEGP